MVQSNAAGDAILEHAPQRQYGTTIQNEKFLEIDEFFGNFRKFLEF